MSEYLQRLRSYTVHGLEEFAQHPVSYTAHSIRELLKDYWDLGAAVLAGAVLADKDGQFFGQYHQALGLILGAASAVGAVSRDFDLGSDRFLRNAVAIFASSLYSENETIPPKIVAGMIGIGAVFMEIARRKRLQEISNPLKKSSLETKVNHL